MKINWLSLDNSLALEQIIERSYQTPCLIFKHSTRCSISSLAMHRLENDWDFSPEELEPYFLDLIANRAVSQQVAETFSVYHESPQVLLIMDGECYYDNSHLDISVADLRDAYQQPTAKSQ